MKSSENIYQKFWSGKVNSHNRFDTNEYLKKKAIEQVGLIDSYAKKTDSILDIGCGAGELLFYMSDKINVKTAIDYSESMLNKVKKRLINSKEIKFIKSDIFEHIPKAEESIWMTIAAVNQYLDSKKVSRFIRQFSENKESKYFFLFDTIDYFGYRTNTCRSSYNPETEDDKKIQLIIKRRLRCIKNMFMIMLFFGKDTMKLDSVAMGYGHSPQLWFSLAEKHGLGVEIVSSRYFEYRYHVILWKK